VYDPAAGDSGSRAARELAFADTVEDGLREADLVLHLTEWPEFRKLDPDAMHRLVNEPRLLDGRNTLNADRWRTAGWTFRALGRPAAAPYEALVP
jgi:UDPglucose 6-dehydrogenase